MDPLLGGAIISGATGLIDNFINRKDTKKQNQQDRQFQQDMWDKTNMYNSPSQQMMRLKAAGLNPNLVYGNGATTTAQNVTPMASKPLPAPNTGQIIGSTIQASQDFQLKDQQKDLNAIQALAIAQSTTNKVQQNETEKFRTNNEGEKFVKNSRENTIGENTRQNTEDGIKASVLNMQLKNTEQEIKNLNLPELQQVAVYEAYARLKLIKAQGTSQQVESALKQEELKLMQKGIQKSDNLMLRIFSEFLPEKTQIKQYAKDAYKYIKTKTGN